MDDTPEDKAPRAKAGTGRKSSRARSADAAAGKAKESKGRVSQAQRSKPEENKPARKAPAKRKSQADIEAAAKPAAAPKARASKPAKEKMARKPRGKAPAKPASAPEVPANAAAPEPEQAPVTRVDSTSVTPQEEGKAADVAIHPVPPHAPSLHPHDEGLEFGLSPVDLPPDPGVREEAGFGWFVRILVLSSVLLVLFNSFAIDKWAREQPVTRLNSQVLIAGRQIHGAMKSLHLDAPVEGMRSLWHEIKAVQWPGSAGNDEKAGAGQPPAK